LTWVLVIGPYVRSAHLGTPERLISIAYPILDVALIATAARLAIGGGRRTTAFWLLTASIIPMVGADTLYSYLSLAGVFPEHSFIEAGWITFYIGWGAAALHPSMRALSTPTASSARISTARLLVLGSAALVPPAVLFIQGGLGVVRDAIPIALAGTVLLVLVLIRTARIARQAAAERSESRFRTLIDKTSDAIVVIDGNGRIRYHTPATERMLGRCASELDGTSLSELLAEDDALRLLVLMTSDSASTTLGWRIQHADGRWREVEVIADDLRDTSDVGGIVFTMRDVTERNRFDLEFRRQTHHDSLTGLANRKQFVVRIDQALKTAKRTDRGVAVLYVNLDDFKMINDSLGHAAGDTLLVAVAARLTTAARSDCRVARLGGDEFGFLLENGRVDGGPELAALRVQAALQGPFLITGKQISVRASIGIAVGSPWRHSADDLLRDADLAMSFAKRMGKDRFELFQPAMHEEATRRLDVAAELLGGIERNELTVYYQPIIDVCTGHLVGAEALARWQHPTLGLLLPKDFIPIAETTGLIGPLDRWVLNEACRQTSAWKKAGVVEDSFHVNVNVSAVHLRDPSVVHNVNMALEASDLDAQALVLEVNESALIEDHDSSRASLASIKRLGVRVAVDNFGIGYSSFAHLITFPIDFIKISKSFIDLVDSSEGETMVRALVDLTHSLGYEAIAEGVEHLEQARAIEVLGCDFVQGNLFAEALSPSEIAALFANQLVAAGATSSREVTWPQPDPSTQRV
jgi:diguanylate cyclase (GGDEF)-like protein/PAS domain S-box-containing protein